MTEFHGKIGWKKSISYKENPNNTLKPKCLLTDRDLSYSVTGHILPCCWVNSSFEDKHLKKLFKDNLHIDNNDSIEDILNSNEWKEFMDLLQNGSDNELPKVCKFFCSKGLDINVENERAEF